MPGLLTYGAIGGVADEYLKQSEESRANEYTAIRDKRLSEIRKEETVHSAELVTEENLRKEGVAKEGAEAQRTHDAEQSKLERESKGPKTVTTTPGSATDYYDTESKSFKPVRSQPTKASTTAADDPNKTGYRLRGTQHATTLEQMRKIWKDQSFVKNSDEYGNTTFEIKPDGQNFFEWFNAHVVPEDQIDLTKPGDIPPDPDLIFEAMKQTIKGFDEQRAIQEVQKRFPDWQGPQSSLIANDTPAPATESSPEPITNSQNAGLLTQGAQAEPASPIQNPPASETYDPVRQSIERKLKSLEQEFANLPERTTSRVPDPRRAALMKEIEKLRGLLGGA